MRNRLTSVLSALALTAFSTGGIAWADDFGDPAAPVQLTYLSLPGMSPAATNPVVKNYYTGTIAGWVKAHPDVHLRIDYMSTDINAALTKLQQQAATGTAPDFAIIDSFFLSHFYDYLQPLDQYFSKEDIDKYAPFAKQGMYGPDGKLKALWINTDVRELMYRPDLVPTPPKTWDELITQGEALTKKGITAYLYDGGRGEGTVICHLPMFWALGGELVDAAGKPVFGEGKNREALLNLLNFIKRTQDTGISPKRVVNYQFESDMFPDILRGNVAMVLGSSYMIKQVHDLGDKHVWAVADIPTRDGNQMNVAGGVTFGVFAKDPAKQKLVTDLIATLIESDKGMSDAAAAIGNLPTKLSLASLDTPYYKDPINQEFIKMLSYARVRPGAAIYSAESVELGVAVSEVVAGQKTPEQALADAWQKVQQEYKP